jgi:hypothetical protein
MDWAADVMPKFAIISLGSMKNPLPSLSPPPRSWCLRQVPQLGRAGRATLGPQGSIDASGPAVPAVVAWGQNQGLETIFLETQNCNL